MDKSSPERQISNIYRKRAPKHTAGVFSWESDTGWILDIPDFVLKSLLLRFTTSFNPSLSLTHSRNIKLLLMISNPIVLV